MPYKRHASSTLFTVSSSIATLQREIEELQQKEQTKSVMKQLEKRTNALKFLQEEIFDDENVDELGQ